MAEQTECDREVHRNGGFTNPALSGSDCDDILDALDGYFGHLAWLVGTHSLYGNRSRSTNPQAAQRQLIPKKSWRKNKFGIKI